MMRTHKRVVVFGGAFNPPHIGHAMMIEAATRLSHPDEIWVMPSKDRGDKKVSASGEDRLRMLELMSEDLSFQSFPVPVMISNFELRLPGLTRTVETKEALEHAHPDVLFEFLIGSEILPDIKTKWVRGEELWQSGHFLVLARVSEIPKDLPSNFIVLGEGSRGADISSTFIRELVSHGASGMPYVTPRVAEFIQEKGLYR